MSLITQCPACTTLFKVVPDQLRISEGWVRCGQCEEIFDANAQMVDEEETPVFGGQSPESEEDFEEPAPALDQTIEEPEPEPEYDPILAKSPAELASSTVEEFQRVPEEVVLPVSPIQNRIEPRLEQLLADSPIAFVPLRDPEEVKAVSVHTWVLVFLTGVLAMVLGLQWLVHERDRLAAMDIGLRPVLSAVCGVLGCEVGHLRQIDAILIDSSSFVKVRNDIYRLNFVLKSNTQQQLAIPAMELTLTDAQDQALFRKVILVSEFGIPSPVIAPGAEVAVSIPLHTKAVSVTDRIAGYKLLAFYP